MQVCVVSMGKMENNINSLTENPKTLEIDPGYFHHGITALQHSFSLQKQKNKSQIQCGNETPLEQISIQGKQNSPLGRFYRPDGCTLKKKRATHWEVAEGEAHPPGGRWRMLKGVGAWRVNADSSTKAATATEGTEEHGKRAKVKGTSQGSSSRRLSVHYNSPALSATPSLCLYHHFQVQPHPCISIYHPTLNLKPQ